MREIKLSLEHLCGYLPYELKMENKLGCEEILRCSNIEHAMKHWKPILRPISDINKAIDHGDYKGINVAKQYELVFFDGQWHESIYAEYGETPKAYIPVTEINTFMFKFHFDVFGLIEQGLAININTLHKP